MNDILLQTLLQHSRIPNTDWIEWRFIGSLQAHAMYGNIHFSTDMTVMNLSMAVDNEETMSTDRYIDRNDSCYQQSVEQWVFMIENQLEVSAFCMSRT